MPQNLAHANGLASQPADITAMQKRSHSVVSGFSCMLHSFALTLLFNWIVNQSI